MQSKLLLREMIKYLAKRLKAKAIGLLWTDEEETTFDGDVRENDRLAYNE